MPDDPAPLLRPSSDPEGAVRAVVAEQAPAETAHKHHLDPCQRAYANFRARIFEGLTKSRRSRLSKGAARAALLFLDVPARWSMNLSDAIIGNRGYFAVGSVLAVYFAVFGLIDAKSTQEETRASVERSLFITLVSSGNAASFVAAMRDFGPTQIMPVTEHPSWFKFWEWGGTYQPNREPMLDWALARLGGCDIKIKDCSFRDNTRLDLRAANLRAADLHAPNPLLDSMAYEDSEAIRADLHEADLTRANLIGANVVGADLSRADLHDANLRRANLQDANLSGANLSSATLIDTNLMGADLHDAVISSTYLYLADVGGANLSGANLSGAHLSGVKGLSQTQLDGACGDENTDLDPPLTIKPCPPLKN